MVSVSMVQYCKSLSAYNEDLPLEKKFSPAEASLEVLQWTLELADVPSHVFHA